MRVTVVCLCVIVGLAACEPTWCRADGVLNPFLQQPSKTPKEPKKAANKKTPTKKPTKPAEVDPAASADSKPESPRASAASDVKFEVIGLQVGKPLPTPKEPSDKKSSGRALGGFGMLSGVQPGTSVSVHFSGPRQFISLDNKASRLVSMTDDQGIDLLGESKPAKSKTKSKTKAKSKPFGGNDGPGEGFGGMFSPPLQARFAEDRQSGTLEFSGRQRPGSGATQITIAADIAFKCGINEKTVELTDVALTKDTPLKAGPLSLTINRIEPGGFGGDDVKINVNIGAKQRLDAMNSIQFFDEEGNEIKSRSMGGFSGGFGEQWSEEKSYGLAKKVDKATIKITYFDKLEDVAVPVKLKFGLGF